MRQRSCAGRRGGRSETVAPRNVIANVARPNWPGDVGVNERRCSIRSTTDDVGIVVVLSVVFPTANPTDLEPPSLTERLAAAARTSERQLGRLCFQTCCVPLQPVDAPGGLLSPFLVYVTIIHSFPPLNSPGTTYTSARN